IAVDSSSRKATEKGIGLASKIHGGNTLSLEGSVILECPIDAKGAGGKSTLLSLLHRLILLGGDHGQEVNGGKACCSSVFKVLQYPIGTLSESLQHRSDIGVVVDLPAEAPHQVDDLAFIRALGGAHAFKRLHVKGHALRNVSQPFLCGAALSGP